MRSLHWGFVALVVIHFIPPSPALGQEATSATVVGVVRDTSGAVLPGVTVEVTSPALIERVKTTTTDSEGRYRVVDLRPGIYAVTFTLPGFKTVRREGLELTTGFTATVNGDLAVGAVQETVTVTGAAPVVDVRSTGQQQLVSGQTLRTLPIGKNSGIYTAVIPGAVQASLA